MDGRDKKEPGHDVGRNWGRPGQDRGGKARQPLFRPFGEGLLPNAEKARYRLRTNTVPAE
jgi:hypothetical protein